MATKTLIPVDEYIREYVLKGDQKPYFEYLLGDLRQKPIPNTDHSWAEHQLVLLIERDGPKFCALPEVHVRIRDDEFLVPDVVIVRVDQIERPYPTRPPHVCVEILSPDQSFGEIFAKCEEYHRWGVPICWVVDATRRRAWNYPNGVLPSEIAADGALEAPEISIPLADLFSRLPPK